MYMTKGRLPVRPGPRYLRALFSGAIAAALAFGALPAVALAPFETNANPEPRAEGFVLPLKAKKYRMTSPMGGRCIPVVGGSTFHLGQDMGASDNEPIYAITTGKVRSIVPGTGSKSGIIVVTHNFNGAVYEFAYMHMWPNDVMVKVGDTVRTGQQIARVGASGPATGPHLHLEIWKERFYSSDNNVVDPVPFLKARGVDLTANASANYGEYDKNCTYYARGKADVFASASSSAKVLARPGRNTHVSSKPGAINGKRNGDFVKVSYGSITGWMDRFAVTPDKLSAAPAGSLTAAGSVTNGVQIPFATFSNPGALNLRAGAATWYSRLATIPAGTKFKAYETGNGWTRVKYGSHEGWVSSPLINKVATIDPATIATTHELVRDLKLREGAGYTYKETHSLKRGAKVAIRRSAGDWVHVQSGANSGWVTSGDIKKIGAATPPAVKPPVSKPGVTPTKTTHITTSNLNMRSGPGTNTKIMSVLNSGTQVIELQRAGEWSQIKVGSQTGWASNTYLKAYKPAPTPPKAPAVTSMKATDYTAKAKTALKKSADAKSASVITIPVKARVTANAKSGSWLRVVYAGKTGWVPANQLALYKAPAKPKPPVVTSMKKTTYTAKAKAALKKSADSKSATLVSIPAKKECKCHR